MNILFVDTSQKRSVIVFSSGDRGAIRFFEKTHALFPILRELLQEFRVDINQVDYFIAGAGPGSFTGVRMGIAALQAMSFACKKEFFMIQSLALYCQGFPVLVDARSGGVYFYEKEPERVKVHSEKELQAIMGQYSSFTTPTRDPLAARLQKMGYSGSLMEIGPTLSTIQEKCYEAILRKEKRVDKILYLREAVR